MSNIMSNATRRAAVVVLDAYTPRTKLYARIAEHMFVLSPPGAGLVSMLPRACNSSFASTRIMAS